MAAMPAYTAVSARQTLHRTAPTEQQPPPSKGRVEWPASVRAYVQRAFEQGNNIPGIEAYEMTSKLKVIISQAMDANHLYQIDWSTYPLPQHVILREREDATRQTAHNNAITNLTTPDPRVKTPTYTTYEPSPSSMKKRKSSDMEMDRADDRETTPPWRKKTATAGLESRITGKSKPQEKRQKKAEAFRSNASDKDIDALQRRRQRFGHVTPEPSPHISSRDESPDALTGPLVGTCQTLEKNYFRLTAPPPPNTVRPLPVLEKALDLIRQKWKTEHNYTYACDQLKSLRQDLTVQHIKTEFTVKVYEVHARIALEMADLGEYNQCQTQLRVLYKMNLGGKPEEFTAYRILYFIYTCNRTGMNDVLADLTPADKSKAGVRHALQVRSALAAGNYHKFFRLYNEAPFMGPYLLDMFVQRERLAAMAAICKSYKPDISVHVLANELAFHGDDDSDESDLDAGPRQCLEFICKHGGEHLIERKDGDVRFLSGKAGQLFENARATAFGKVDIKGQI